MANAFSDIEKRIPEIVKGALKRVPVLFQGYIGVQFTDGGGRGGRNTTNRLRIQSGRLLKSFLPNSPENFFKVTQRGTIYGVQIGTNVPYARIHEEGGTIVQPRSPKQRRFFWAKFYETKDVRVKYAALSTKPLTINIPARPYFKPAREEFFRDGVPLLQKIIRDALLREFAL
jgi:phage gpG-like protein